MPPDFKKITEKFQEAMVNPELDRMTAGIRKALEEAKDAPNKDEVVARVLERGKSTLTQDLTELNIPADQQPQLLNALETRFRVATTSLERNAIFSSLEGQKLNAFANDFTKFTKLDAVIAECKARDSKKPMKRFISAMRAATPLFAGMGASLMQWLNARKQGEAETSEPTGLETAAARADEVMEGDEGKKADQKPAQQTADTGTSSRTRRTAPSSGAGEGGGQGGSRSGGGGRARVESAGSARYEINPDNAKKLSPEEFRKRYESITNPRERHMFVLQQIAAGNASNAFERLRITGQENELEVEVDQGPLTVAGIEVQTDGPTSMAAAQLTGCVLPTRWLVDRTYEQAKANKGMVDFVNYDQIVRALNIPEDKAYTYTMKDGVRTKHPNGTLMMSAQFSAKRDEMIRAWSAKNHIDPNRLRAGHFKEIIQPSAGRPAGMLSIYGAVDSNGRIIQDGEGPHDQEHSDYSNLLRRVREKVWVKNKKTGERKQMTFAEFYSNPEYAREFGFEPPKPGQAYSYSPELQQFVTSHQKTKKSQPNA